MSTRGGEKVPFAPGTHHGILIVWLQQPTRRELARCIQTIFLTERVEEWSRCFVVVTDHKIRVRRPLQQETP